jgi:IS30 family transposase
VGRHPKSAEIRGRFWRARASGATLREAAAAAGISKTAAHYWLKESGGLRPRARRPESALRLSLGEREEISRGLASGMTLTAIAAGLGRAVSTVSREVRRNSGPKGYRAVRAQRLAQARTARPRPPKLAGNDRLRRVVEGWLAQRWSPEQITGRLKVDYPDDLTMRVSHETIYTSLFVQAKKGLPGELTVHLRTRRVRRRPQRRVASKPQRIKDMVPIQQRPPEADDRLVAGHWEGDLIVGRGNQSYVGTLVERTSRFLILLHLPGGGGTDGVLTALFAAVRRLPPTVWRSITWDRGIEMTRHLDFTRDTGVPVFFCAARSPWQRGTNENTNGLLRQYLPKGTDLFEHTPAQLQVIADALNNRPRRTLGWQTPHEVMTRSVALVA